MDEFFLIYILIWLIGLFITAWILRWMFRTNDIVHNLQRIVELMEERRDK